MKILKAAILSAVSFLLCFTFLFAGCSGKTVEPVVGSWSAENIVVNDSLVFDKMTVTVSESLSENNDRDIFIVDKQNYRLQFNVTVNGQETEIQDMGIVYYCKLMRVWFNVDNSYVYFQCEFKQKAESIYIKATVACKSEETEMFGDGTDIILK